MPTLDGSGGSDNASSAVSTSTWSNSSGSSSWRSPLDRIFNGGLRVTNSGVGALKKKKKKSATTEEDRDGRSEEEDDLEEEKNGKKNNRKKKGMMKRTITAARYAAADDNIQATPYKAVAPPAVGRFQGEGGGNHVHAMMIETRKQDEDMDVISGVLDALNHAGQMMGEELDKQVRPASCMCLSLSRIIVVWLLFFVFF